MYTIHEIRIFIQYATLCIHWYIIYLYINRDTYYVHVFTFIYLHDMCNYVTIISTILLQIQIHCLCLCNPTLITRWLSFHKMEAMAHFWMIYIDLEVSNPWGLPPKSSITIGFPIINPGINPGWWFGTFFIFHNMWDNPSHWLSYFSEGLKPPTRTRHFGVPPILGNPHWPIKNASQHRIDQWLQHLLRCRLAEWWRGHMGRRSRGPHKSYQVGYIIYIYIY